MYELYQPPRCSRRMWQVCVPGRKFRDLVAKGYYVDARARANGSFRKKVNIERRRDAPLYAGRKTSLYARVARKGAGKLPVMKCGSATRFKWKMLSLRSFLFFSRCRCTVRSYHDSSHRNDGLLSGDSIIICWPCNCI